MRVPRWTNQYSIDSSGSPLPGVVVTFAVTAGGGELAATSVLSDASGRAATTLTLGIEGTRRCLRRIVAHAGGKQRVEYRHFGDAQLFSAAGDHRPLLPAPNGFVGVADPLTARSASAGSRNDAPGNAEKYAEMERLAGGSL